MEISNFLFSALLLWGQSSGFSSLTGLRPGFSLGDAGSFILGFSLLFVCINSSQEPGSLVRPVSALLIMAMPIVDTLTIMTRRAIYGRSPFMADRYHLHHIIVRFGFSKEVAVRIILLMATVSSLTAIAGVVLKIPDHLQFLTFMLFFGGYFTTSFFIKDFLKIFLKHK